MGAVERVYLDLCCLKRPFDEAVQPRLRLEAEAVLQVLEEARAGSILLVGSAALRAENSLNPDPLRRDRVGGILRLLEEPEVNPEDVEKRVAEVHAWGFGSFDALHVAWAESGAARVLLSTDDRLLASGRRWSARLRVTLLDPIAYVKGLAR